MIEFFSLGFCSLLLGVESFTILLTDPCQAGCVFCPNKEARKPTENFPKILQLGIFTWLYSTVYMNVSLNLIELNYHTLRPTYKFLGISFTNVMVHVMAVQLLGVLRWVKTRLGNYKYQNISR